MTQPDAARAAESNAYDRYVSTHVLTRKELPTTASIAARIPKLRALYGQYLPAAKSTPILDAGCGHGTLLHWLQAEGFTCAEGVDVSAEQVLLGRSLGIQNLQVGSLEDYLSQRPCTYAVIFMRDVLEHIPKSDVSAVLDLCALSLQPGGILVIQVPNADSPFFGRIRYGDFTHQAAYNKSSLSQLFLLAGLEPLDFKPAIVLPLTFRTVRKWISWKFFSFMYRAGLSAELGPGDYIVSMNIVAVARKSA